MTSTALNPDLTNAHAPTLRAPASYDRTVTLARLAGPQATLAIITAFVAAILAAVATVIVGHIATGPSGAAVLALAVCLLGSVALDTIGRTVWSVIADRAEGRLRSDLLTAALDQPLQALGEQAVGEVLDRVDDDGREVGLLVRQQLWESMRTAFATLPMWVVAGLTWWPAWILFPVVAALVFVSVRSLLPELSRRKVDEEIAWTDHAAALEEGIAARDDLRASLGRAYLLRRNSELAGRIHQLFDLVVTVQSQMVLRTGLLLHGLLILVAVGGVVFVAAGSLSTAAVVTLFLVTTTFAGQVAQLTRFLPDLQAGMGAVLRLRGLLAAQSEPQGGLAVGSGPLTLEFRGLHFAYQEGVFALADIDLEIPAGQTCALVGRTGSGKSTLASLISRAVEPEPGSVFLGGVDVCELDINALRSAVGVVTQRTEILAGTLAENIAIFAEVPRENIAAAVAELDLQDWVDGLPDGLDTQLGPGGTRLSAGEEQLVAFARLLVRDVSVVVLDEATARMDPLTEARVVHAADRLLRGRTGVLVAHRLSTVARADLVAILDSGRVVDQGPRAELERRPGAYRRLLDAAVGEHHPDAATATEVAVAGSGSTALGGRRRTGTAPPVPQIGPGISLTRGVVRMLLLMPQWCLLSSALFLVSSLGGAVGLITNLLWGKIVENLDAGTTPVALTVALVICIMIGPISLAIAVRRFPRWWVEVLLRVRTSVLAAQTEQHRLAATPPGEVVARTLDADRFPRYADQWIDVINGIIVLVIALAVTWNPLVAVILMAVPAIAAAASAIGRPIAGRSATVAAATRAAFGRSLVSMLEGARTVKLAAATPAVRAHLGRVDAGRVDAAILEHRVQAVLAGVPQLVVQAGTIAAWGIFLGGGWDLSTALLVSGAITGFGYFGRVAGQVVINAPGTRSWQSATSRFAGGGDLMTLPAGVDLVSGTSPSPKPATRDTLRELRLYSVSAIHPDGTVGVSDVDLTVRAGELVLLLGQVGSGKSSLIAALCGVVHHTGSVRWNGEPVADPQTFLRPGRVAYVAQVPRVLSGTFADNIRLDHLDRAIDQAIDDARLRPDDVRGSGHDRSQ
ncbi:ABC transporter ATP-binding protein [Williamsia sp. CHRR-6]|uniref:ATP-binding cassette domain-containing protein n=1 Tax=Williamsia sp. CHRR-6 TaxID=2835871 RepID=UPI001BD9808A|nr:ABC transporter ATP-binding protein [Williamsia sp. CHRR-6]MBT0568653.1 ABC transporter ATP-binding protein [Williamsia sp. CHRR-6]